ncbi:unnamed protein product, partial [Rotaria magnacalcarata]
MLSALNTSENCPVQMQQALDIVISRICDIRVRFLISYAWSYSVANDEINSSATFMKNILKENEEYYSLLDKNNENSNRIINWVKLTQQAEYIYRTTSRRTNKWQEIGRLMKTPLMIDENIENAFLNSRSAGDAHVWFYNLNESSQGTIHMTYEPQLALVDFGIVFSGIRQRLVQQILLHNETDKDINIQLERHHETNPNEFDFNMTPDTVIVSANSIAEIDVLFKSPENFIGDIHEMLDINIDNQQLKFNSAIQLRVQMVKVDLEIGSGAVKIEQFETEFWQIDFGSIPCAATPVVKSIELKNVLESTIQVKAQVQTNEKNYQSHLNIVKNDLTIDGKTTTMLNLTLQPTEMINIDEDFEAIVCLAITPSKNIKWLKPNFRSSPQSIIEWGKIEINRTNQLLFEVKNIGANPLRFITRSVKTKQPFVNEAFISSTAMEINSINHPFRVNPNDKVRFSINIKSSSIDSNQIEPSPIELAELDLQSLCDPVMSIDGQLQDRSIKIFVIGRLDKYDPINEIRLIGSKPKDWSNLRLIPTKDIREIEQNMNKHEPYSLFITMTCAAYAARSNEIIAIPKIKDDYETLVGKVHLAAKHLTAPLSLKDICGKVSIDVIKILYKYFQLTVDQPEYFHHSISLHNSLYSIHSGIPIRLQLYAIVNSTNNNDEAYTMQSYATTILSVYENINEKENLCCQSLQTIDKCIGKDPLMPECLRSFIEYIRLVTKPTTDLNEIEHLLADRIGSSSGLRDLLGSNLNDNKWTLRFSCIPNEIKEIVIALIEQENNSYSSLLSCHLAAASLDKYAGWQNSLLQGLKWARKLWIDINEKEQLNLLSGIFSDQIKLADLLTRLESKNDFKRTVIEATESILNYLNCSNYFLNVVTIYQCASSKRFDLLWNLGFRDYKIRYALELHIDSCKATRNLNDFVHQFCEILRIILVLEAHQWISVRTSVYNFCVLFSRILNANVNTVNQILIDSMSLAAEFRSNTIFWSKIQEEFKQVVCNPESDTLKSFIHTMAAIDDKNSSKSEIQKMITQINHINSMEPNETTFEHVFQLCQMIMTNEQLIQFRQKCEKIEEIPSTSSIVDALSNMQSIVSDSVEFQQSIKAYLFLVQLPNNLTANEDDQTQYELLEQIIPSWLIIMNEKSKINQSFFNIISSVLTSFHGLLLSRGISFKERLYTMVLINALCLLSNYRFMKHSLTDQSQQSKRTSISLVESIRRKLIRQIQSAPITSKPSIPSVDNDPVESINTPQPTRPRLTKQASIVTTTHPYSIAMLAKMSDFMKKYADQRTSQQRTFEDSDKLCDIVQQIINNHQNIDLWLSAFTTFIRILRYNVDLDSTTTTVQARDIIEHGLQLLLNSLAIKRILEPSFSSTGVIFIDNDISRIEKCLLSLALENSPLLRHTLYQLHVDVSRIKQILPSRIFSPIPPSPPLLRTDNNSKDTSPPDTYDGVHNPISTDKPILDRPMNGSDWLKEMKNDDALSIKDTPGTNTGNSRKPTTFTKFDTSQDNKINRIQPLVNNLLPTGFDIQTTAGIGTTSTTYDSLEADMENMDAANIKLDLTESALREHMKKQAEIIEQYRKSNSKTTDNKSHETLQDRGKLEFNKKIEHWTYQKLVQSKTIAWIIDTMLEEFQKRWEQLLNNRVNQLEVRWCIMIDNSGSMSLHRNLIYESLVILMELLRKMEFKFSVARFGGRTNQKILKDIDQLFTDQDGQFILEAISLDEGTYPATGLARIADKIFPVTTSEPNAHQFVLMITDGLTQEREEKSFSTTINKNKINLGIMFIESIEHSSNDETKDAQALECAIDLLKNSSTRGEKKIFIITDGYGNSGNLLPLVQQRADEANIDIIAMAIGDDRTNLHGCYKRYIRCTTPYGLPKALRALFDNDTSNESVDQPIAIKTRSDIPDDASDKDMCLTDIKNSKVFKDLIEKLQGEREKLLINSGDPPSHMRCDICFCIDCTGSMSRWLSETKVQMKFIIKEIKKQITEKYPSLKLQLFFSIVAFRDVGDRQPFEILDFTDNDMQIINFLDQLTAYGGEDQPEDVMGALNECLNLKNWSKSNARFIVLITDAPGHGRELNDDASDRYPSGTGHSVSSICDRLLQQDSEIEFMFCCVNPAATLKMQRAFETYYNAKKDQTGKEFKTIKLFGDQPIDSRLFHFVFILDESGSMSGYGWNSLLRAYQSFLDRRRNDQGSDDLFSVIQFQSTARNICDKKR